jgi:hypothetical protein
MSSQGLAERLDSRVVLARPADTPLPGRLITTRLWEGSGLLAQSLLRLQSPGDITSELMTVSGPSGAGRAKIRPRLVSGA